MRRVVLLIGVLAVAAPAWAQDPPDATPSHRLTWDQADADITGYTYEAGFDAQPFGPLLGVACTGSSAPRVCQASFPQSLTAGRHAVRLRAVRVVNGVRQESPASADFPFDWFPVGPTPPGNLRLTVPPGAQGVAVNGTIQQRYPFAGLDVASAWLEEGVFLYVGAERLATSNYSVMPGDKISMVVYR